MFALLPCVSTLSVLFCRALFVLKLGLLDESIVCELSFLLSYGHLSLCMLSLVDLTVQDMVSLAVLGHLLVLQRIYIWHFYLYVLILLYTHIIVCYLTD